MSRLYCPCVISSFYFLLSDFEVNFSNHMWSVLEWFKWIIRKFILFLWWFLKPFDIYAISGTFISCIYSDSIKYVFFSSFIHRMAIACSSEHQAAGTGKVNSKHINKDRYQWETINYSTTQVKALSSKRKCFCNRETL